LLSSDRRNPETNVSLAEAVRLVNSSRLYAKGGSPKLETFLDRHNAAILAGIAVSGG
jgi:hypothetical protein